MKETRRIHARGLTASDRGKVIEYMDIHEQLHKVKIDTVSYEGNQKTVVTFVSTVRLPNNLEIEIID